MQFSDLQAELAAIDSKANEHVARARAWQAESRKAAYAKYNALKIPKSRSLLSPEERAARDATRLARQAEREARTRRAELGFAAKLARQAERDARAAKKLTKADWARWCQLTDRTAAAGWHSDSDHPNHSELARLRLQYPEWAASHTG